MVDMVRCPECGDSIGEDEIYCPFCDADIFGQDENVSIPSEKDGETALFVHNIQHEFKVGDIVIDITAEENGWPDVKGEIVAVDGSNIKVHYKSGTERWKLHINLRMEDQSRGG